MQTEAIRAFVTVCDRGSFQAAAETLHLSQPTISKRLAALETRLGHDLFDRVGRGVALTEAGQGLHARLWTVYEEAIRARLGHRMSTEEAYALSRMLIRLYP